MSLDVQLLHRRYVPDATLDQTSVTDGLGFMLYEWQIRRLLFQFVEQRLNEKIMIEMKVNQKYC